MHVVILAAGKGTRMAPLTLERPKPLLPVGGRPLLWWTLDRCRQAGFRDATVVVHHGASTIQRFLKASAPRGMTVRTVRQSQPLGTGHAVQVLAPTVREPFVLVYGDVLPTVEDLRRLREARGQLVAGAMVENASAFGELDAVGGRLRTVREKTGKPRKGLVNAGLYRFEPTIFDHLQRVKRSPRGEYELTDALSLAAKSEGVRVLRIRSWLETGRAWDLLGAQEEVMQDLKPSNAGKVEAGVVMQGPVRVGKGSVVKAGTYIEGPVWIGEDCKIGPRTYLRPSTAIGDGCHIGASVEIKNSIIMDRSNVPHLSYIGDSVIGSDCNLGAGTTTANLKVTPHNIRVQLADGSKVDSGRRKLGAIIGDRTKIGINSSLGPGTVIGNDCLIGMAKAVTGWIPDGSRLL